MSTFARIVVRNWRQFAEIDIRFHPRLTILTGANGAGKTTLLHLLNRHWGWNIPVVSTLRFKRKETATYWAGFWANDDGSGVDADTPPYLHIGFIEYIGHHQATLKVPEKVSETFAIEISPQAAIPGVYVPSHRPLYIHQKVESIPTTVDARQQIFDVYLQELRNRWAVNHRVKSPSHTLKTSLISLATFGYGNEAVVPNSLARETLEGFERALSVVLPPSIGFERLRVRVPDVFLQTSTGEFSLDAVSGGVSAIIDVTWQVYLYSTLHDSFTVVIDEPEAHLHPALQRTFLPNLLQVFPNASFVVATHNPLVIGAARDSSVYVLQHGPDGKVRSQLLDQADKSGTANELLRDVLGLPATTAVWVADEVQRIIDKYDDSPMTQQTLDSLRSDLADFGLAKHFPHSVKALRK